MNWNDKINFNEIPLEAKKISFSIIMFNKVSNY